MDEVTPPSTPPFRFSQMDTEWEDDSFEIQTAPATTPRRLPFDDDVPGTPEKVDNLNWENMGGVSPMRWPKSPVSEESEESECSRFAEEFVQKGDDIGQGSFGVVVKAQHRLDGHIYAVKKSKEPVTGRSKESRLQEVYAVASLPRCQHIVKYYDCWIEHSYLYIRFEFCEGGNIENVVSWTYPGLLELFYQVSIGLQSLHGQSVVHLDVKAENIYMTYKDGKTIYKLGDFGLVRKVTPGREWEENDGEGDSRYLCQAFLNDKTYPKAADVFALAATVYEAARGERLPGRDVEWQAIRDHPAVDIEGRYPLEFVTLIKDCMDPKPETRPACLDILSNSVFDTIKEASGQVDEIKDMESELRKLRAQLASSPRTNTSSPPGLSPSDYTPSASPSPLAQHHASNPIRELPPPSLSQPRCV